MKLKKLGYSALAWLGLCTAIVPLIYAIVYWIRYPKIAEWTAKWSGGEFTVPAARFNFCLLHGLGVIAMAGVVASLVLNTLMMSINFSETFAIAIVVLIPLLVETFCVWGYWKLVCKYSKMGLTPKGNAFMIGYGALSLAAWALIAVLAVYALMAVVALVVGFYLIKFIWFACFSEEINVKSGGFFGGVKKIMATRNWDGTYTDIEGNKYK